MRPAGLIWRGAVHDVDLGQPTGHEPAFRRPAVVVSADLVNNGPGGMVAVVPVSTNAYGLRSHVELQPEPSGLDRPSWAHCDQLRVVSSARLVGHRGVVSAAELHAIERALRSVLEL